MIEEEIYVPRGNDDTLLEKLHRQHDKCAPGEESSPRKNGSPPGGASVITSDHRRIAGGNQ
jgi:hypothetical protein